MPLCSAHTPDPSPFPPVGSLLAFECLSDKLGRLFEPYVIQILPMLLGCFGDPAQAVRDAADGAARAIMGQLTGARGRFLPAGQMGARRELCGVPGAAGVLANLIVPCQAGSA